jgi:hypothetical protein
LQHGLALILELFPGLRREALTGFYDFSLPKKTLLDLVLIQINYQNTEHISSMSSFLSSTLASGL